MILKVSARTELVESAPLAASHTFRTKYGNQHSIKTEMMMLIVRVALFSSCRLFGRLLLGW